MKILITGANRGLGRELAKKFQTPNNSLFLTARNIESLNDFSDSTLYSLNLNSSKSISSFFNNVGLNDNFDLIVHCASPFEGTLESNRYDDFDLWSNSFGVALKLSKLGLHKLNDDGKLIFIGSVAGMPGHISKSCVPYSVYKGSLSLLAEGFCKEAKKTGLYINLGGFRDEPSDEYLKTSTVVAELLKFANDSNKAQQVNLDLMSDKDKTIYL